MILKQLASRYYRDFVVAEMEGSCALRQGTAACGLTGGDADTLNVEHELTRWLQDLDTSVSRLIVISGGGVLYSVSRYTVGLLFI